MAKKLKIIRNGGMYSKRAARRKKVLISTIALILTAVMCSGYFFIIKDINFKAIYNILITSDKDDKQTDTETENSDSEQNTSETDSADSTQDITDTDVIPPLEYDSDAVGMFGDVDKKVYIFNNVAYEIFYGNDSSAQGYADTVNSLASKLKSILGDKTKFYSLVIPTRSEFTLPDKQKIKAGTFSQKNNIQAIADALDDSITPINVIDSLMLHRDEYIFFNTDPLWTAKGAYYGYEEFCRVSQNTPLPLEELVKNTNSVEGYMGTAGMTAKNKEEAYKIIEKNKDTVEYYDIPGNYTVTVTDNNGDTQNASLYYPSPSSTYAYAVFLFGGDSPVMNIKTENNTGKNLLIIKDNSANAMIPYLVSNYDEITIVDYRYTDGSIDDLIKNKGINEVLFLNGIMDANTGIRNSSMSELLK